MKNVKKIVALAAALALTANVAACNNSGTKEPGADDKVRIAVAGPMTGDNSEYGIGFYNAVTLMAEKWNADGGINGAEIEVVQFDDKNSPEEAVSVANKIVSEGNIHGVIGHFASGVSMAAAPIYQENKIIELSPSASHPDYSGIGDYIFRNNTVIMHEAKAALDIAINDFGKLNIGIVSIMTDWGVSTAGVVKDLVAKMESTGAKVVAHEEVIEGSDDYRPAITKLNEAGADVVISVGMYNLLAPLSIQYKEVNPDIKIVGFSNSYSQQLLELGGAAVEGVAFPVIFFSESDDPDVKDFVDSYTEKFGAPPSALTAQAYDSAGIYFQAVEKVGTSDMDALRDEVGSLEYNGVTGVTQFDEHGDVEKSFTKVIIEDGKFVLMNKN